MKSMMMSFCLLALLLAGCKQSATQVIKATTTRDILLEQLRATHNKKDWFVPVHDALEGVTAEQAMWRDSSGNHSIGQLAHHLVFWNIRELAKFNGQAYENFSGNNDETFTAFNKENWEKTVHQLDSVLEGLEKSISAADENKLKDWYGTLANINTHNAYHTGQIIYVRKMKGWWNAEKGVK